MRAGTLSVAVVASVVFGAGGRAGAQCGVNLVDDDPVAEDHAGYCVAQGDGRCVVGVPRSNTGGSVRVYELVKGGWVETAELPSPAPGVQDGFSRDVAIAGDYVAVGAPLRDDGALENAGVVYVYRRITLLNQPVWFLDATIPNPWPADGDGFGNTVAMRMIDGVPVLAVGSPWATVFGHENAGLTWVFARDEGGDWTPESVLAATVVSDGQNFGYKLDLSDDRLVVGAGSETVAGETHAGAAYVFDRSGMNWVNGVRILAPVLERDPSDFFGSDVAVSGDRIAVGALGEDEPEGPGSGVVYVFAYDGVGWTLEDRLIGPGLEVGDTVGASIDMEGGVVASGLSASNRVVAWRSDGAGGWVFADMLSSSDPVMSGNEQFGDDVALSPGGGSFPTVLIGAPYADPGGVQNAGMAFVMVVRCCPVDWDRNGVVNSTDVSRFINEWFEDQVKGTLLTDFNGDGVVNSTDVSDFINAWFEGCGG